MICRQRTVVRLFSLLALLGMSLVAAAAPPDSAADSPRAVIETLDSRLLETMKQADALGFAGRYRQLAPVIDETFDLERIARLALGREWDSLDAEQQQAYTAKFRRDTIATYAQRFDGYDGQRFEIVDVGEAAGGRRQVDTVIIDGAGERTPINYVLAETEAGWQVINVVAGGVSDLALKRGQYTGVIRSQGAAAFLERFDAQLAKYPELPE